MSGPGREFDKMFGPGRAARLARGRGSRVADFARGRGARGAGRRPPATLPTLLGTEAANSYPSHHSQAAKCRTLLAHWQPLPGAMTRMRRPVRLLRALVATRRLDPGPGDSEAHATRSQHSIPSLATQARRPGGAYSTSPASPTPVPRQPTLPHPAPPFEPSPSTRRPVAAGGGSGGLCSSSCSGPLDQRPGSSADSDGGGMVCAMAHGFGWRGSKS